MCSIAEHLTMSQTQALERICLYIDMEGFFLPKFHVRELGYANYLGGSGSKHYWMPMLYTDLVPSQQRQANFVTRRIHGLPFTPTHFEDASPQEQLQQDVADLYTLNMTPEKTVIPYKGGHIEKDLLKEMELGPFVDLEDFGCPKVSDLVHHGFGQEVWDCGLHQGNGAAHCAMAECQIVRDWVVCKINQLKKKNNEQCEQ